MFNCRRTFQFAIILLLLAAGSVSFGQTLQPGPQVLTFFSDVDDTEQPYGLHLPKNFKPAEKYPLVIMLHGAGSNHRLALRRVFGKSNLPGETDAEATRYFPEWKDVDYIVASLYARGTMGYQGIAEKDVYDMLADVKRRFPIDEDRVYLTGLSMGGGGTLWIGLSRPDIWAAIAPVCPAPPDDTAELAPNALNYPVHIFHGEADPVVDPAGVREWVKRLEELETKVEYTEYPGVGHNSWENTYKDEAIFAWFSQFRRNRYPDRVRFATSQYKYNTAYWIRIDELMPGTLANIDAKFTATNRVEITTSELGAFTLSLAGHPKFDTNRSVEMTTDGKKVKAKVTDTLSLSKRQGKWVAAKYAAPKNAKQPGAEGPISEAIAGRHVYVYGTADNPSPAVLQARREQADQAANWSVDRGPFLRRVMVFPRVLADKDVRPSDLETSNLVLFGTKETNSLVAKFSERLPIHFNAAAPDYGLVYVFPVDEHYVLISSGLPWWTVAGSANPPTRRGFRPLFGPPGGLMDFMDYVLFKGSVENVVAAGRFDRNWRVPEADLQKMTATGAVTTVTVATKSQNWISLFDGKTLKGWEPSENKESWQVADGALVSKGPRSHLFYTGGVNNHDFKNFELMAEVKTTPGSNSGIYIHTEYQETGWPAKGYECQVINSNPVVKPGEYVERKMTGSLYAIRNVWKAPAQDGVWFNYRIVVQGKTIRTYINDELMVDYTEPDNTFRPEDKKGRLLASGTFALQCHDPKSIVYYRNIKVKTLPDDTPTPGRPLEDPEFDRTLTQLANDNFPLMDLHVHLKGGLEMEPALANARKYGFTYGLAVNCGLQMGFETNAAVEQYLANYKKPPHTFLAMQAEGREWLNMFSKETIAKFDYVFTDAMTWTNDNGKRMRLWIKEETEIGDPQNFMEQLVDRIEKIVNNEPIDIYVNATYIPDEINHRYDELWTTARMDRVIKALVDHKVAMEINDRRKIPSATFIKRAKAAGVKFTFGTNNAGADDLGNLSYCIAMAEACGLTDADMWRPQEKKP